MLLFNENDLTLSVSKSFLLYFTMLNVSFSIFLFHKQQNVLEGDKALSQPLLDATKLNNLVDHMDYDLQVIILFLFIFDFILSVIYFVDCYMRFEHRVTIA